MGAKRPGEFELLVLMAALRLGPAEAYAVPIVEEIALRTGRRVRRANVYTALQRLESKGLVRSHLGEPLPERGGKARRLIDVTDAGIAAAREAATGIQAMWSGLESLVEDRS